MLISATFKAKELSNRKYVSEIKAKTTGIVSILREIGFLASESLK